ncbi:MAG TPA: hypothetical protein VGE63_02675 [Candidatus Paceibacterota bacterium]
MKTIERQITNLLNDLQGKFGEEINTGYGVEGLWWQSHRYYKLTLLPITDSDINVKAYEVVSDACEAGRFGAGIIEIILRDTKKYPELINKRIIALSRKSTQERPIVFWLEESGLIEAEPFELIKDFQGYYLLLALPQARED